MSDDVKRKAMDAVAAIRTEVTKMRETGSVERQTTPTPSLSQKVGDKVAQMQKSGYDAERLHEEITKDNFTR